MGFHLLALAIAFEVSATLGLKAAASSERPWIPAALAIAGYAIAFFCLSRSLVSLPVGLAYAVWAGVGTVGVAVLGAYFFGENPPPAAWFGVALVVSGVVVLGASIPPH
jgi:small multidrug resistance pump